MKVSIYYSIIYNFLLKNYKLRDKKNRLGWLWRKSWALSLSKYSGPVSTKIHGFKVKVNNGNSYPLFARLFTNYNNPLLQLASSVCNFEKRELVLIDVGSATGDTNLMLMKNLPNTIGLFFCIEGDNEFYSYLVNNGSFFTKASMYNVLLSDVNDKQINSLVKIHPGTATAAGKNKVKSISLDSLLLNDLKGKVDILKIDVDGFDGVVLKGSTQILEKFKPYIIFEWHPILVENSGNSCLQHFEILKDYGYNRFLWFNKYGEFSHFDFDCSIEIIQAYVKLCLRNIHDFDWHYDVIAIHKESDIDVYEIAEMEKAKSVKSRF